jgi:hypothetical protein
MFALLVVLEGCAGVQLVKCLLQASAAVNLSGCEIKQLRLHAVQQRW